MDASKISQIRPANPGEQDVRKYEIVYWSVIALFYIHVAAAYGIYLAFTSAALATSIFNFVVLIISLEGLAAGAHRLWSHKSYKATRPLEILLMILNSITAQFTVENWVRDHRLHHKYSDTHADPHNPSNGFFFAHIGWLMVLKHNDVKEKGKTIDISDIKNNPVLAFQKKYAFLLLGLLGFVLPTLLPMYFWSETFNNAYHMTMLRFCAGFNTAFTINSVGHSSLGFRPYDEKIKPSQNLFLNIITHGEGNHNYHHVFPWDYRSSEWGIDSTTLFINLFKKIGWAYDLKVANPEMIDERSARTGDGTRSRIFNYLRHVQRVKLAHQYSGEAKIGAFKHHVFLYKLYDKRKSLYRAFCAGSIIGELRVLTSANCFLTNRKRRKLDFNDVRVVAGVLETLTPKLLFQDTQQWRMIEHLYTQRFYRFPMYNLAVLKIDEEWNFNQYVGKIPYTVWDQDFDGVCYGTTVKSTKSWAKNKNLFIVSFRLISRRNCEHKLLRSCLQFYCTEYDTMAASSVELEGGGLICFGTEDPAEDPKIGVLVGVTSLINVGLPCLHNRIGLFHNWVTDRGCSTRKGNWCLIILNFLTLCSYY